MITKTDIATEAMIALNVIDDPTCAPPAEIVRPTAETMTRLKAMADETRAAILLTLLHAGSPVCVCSLLPGIGVGQATVSHHLKVLREAGLVSVERRGIWAHYGIAPEVGDWLRATLC